MTPVEKIKIICKERKIPISKLEKECGFANGYISQLKKGMMPYDRLMKVCSYLSLSAFDLVEEENDKPVIVESNIDIQLTNMDEHIKSYALKLSELSKENQDLIMQMIDKLR